MSRTRSVLCAVEALLGIDLLRVGRVVWRLLLWVDWHQILQVELFFFLALASKADGGSGQENGGDEFAGDGGPCDDVRPVVSDSGVVFQDLKRMSPGFGKRPISVQLRDLRLATAGSTRRRQPFPFRRTQRCATIP